MSVAHHGCTRPRRTEHLQRAERLRPAGLRTPLLALLLAGPLVFATACGGSVTLSASSLQPAVLPLRAFPSVVILRGHLDEEVRIGRGLGEHLERFGHVRVLHVSEEELRARLRSGAIPPVSAIVEVHLDVREQAHRQFGAPGGTVCDSLSCYMQPASGDQDLPTLKGTLTLTVRDAATMGVRQQARLKALELGGEYEDMRSEVTLTLIERARILVDHRRVPESVLLLAPDVDGVADAVDLAEDGDWAAARARLRASVASGQALPAGVRARLLHDFAQASRYAGEAARPAALREARAALREAVRLEPEERHYREALRSVEADLDSARRIVSQRAAAARNFRFASSFQ